MNLRLQDAVIAWEGGYSQIESRNRSIERLDELYSGISQASAQSKPKTVKPRDAKESSSAPAISDGSNSAHSTGL